MKRATVAYLTRCDMNSKVIRPFVVVTVCKTQPSLHFDSFSMHADFSEYKVVNIQETLIIGSLVTGELPKITNKSWARHALMGVITMTETHVQSIRLIHMLYYTM